MEALSILESQGHFDMVLLDVMMPGMSGFDVCLKIREKWSVQELPVIFLTAKNQVQDLIHGFGCGANDYVVKPINKDELLSRVGTHLKLLDLNRDLDTKVTERTRELHRQYQELETLNNIVKAINREVELKEVIDTLLDQARVLFPRTERGFFLLWNEEEKLYHFVGVIGYDLEVLKKAGLTRSQLMRRYARDLRQIARGIYIGDEFMERTSEPPFSLFTPPRSLIAMAVHLENRAAGYLVLENLTDTHVYQDQHGKMLERFREHAVSAIAKAKVLRDLVGTQKALIESAHMAGMSEIATEVLHHIGNSLNSVRTSAYLIRESTGQQRSLMLFERVVSLLKEHRQDLTAFFRKDPRAGRVPEALERIFSEINRHWLNLDGESVKLVEHVQTIVKVLQEQQKYTGVQGMLLEPADLNALIRETLTMKAYLLKEQKVQLIDNQGEVPWVLVEIPKFRRLQLYLMQNAWEAIALKAPEEGGRIALTTLLEDDLVVLRITDNGIGIASEQLEKVFEQGFTTKKNGRGFGLHYSANSMSEMLGTIKIQSGGIGTGATVSLYFKLAEVTKEPRSAIGVDTLKNPNQKSRASE